MTAAWALLAAAGPLWGLLRGRLPWQLVPRPPWWIQGHAAVARWCLGWAIGWVAVRAMAVGAVWFGRTVGVDVSPLVDQL